MVLAFGFIIPNDKFKDKKTAILFKILLFLVPLVLAVLKNMSTIGIASTEVTKYYTFKEALKNPFRVLKIFLNTFLERAFLDSFTGFFDGFGVSTKWLRSIYDQIIFIIYVFLIAVAKDDEKIPKIDKIVALVVGLMIYGSVYCSLLFTWTPQDSTTVCGLQPRYFLVPMLLIYMAIPNNIFKMNIKNKKMFYSYSILLIYFIELLSIAHAFY